MDLNELLSVSDRRRDSPTAVGNVVVHELDDDSGDDDVARFLERDDAATPRPPRRAALNTCMKKLNTEFERLGLGHLTPNSEGELQLFGTQLFTARVSPKYASNYFELSSNSNKSADGFGHARKILHQWHVSVARWRQQYWRDRPHFRDDAHRAGRDEMYFVSLAKQRSVEAMLCTIFPDDRFQRIPNVERAIVALDAVWLVCAEGSPLSHFRVRETGDQDCCCLVELFDVLREGNYFNSAESRLSLHTALLKLDDMRKAKQNSAAVTDAEWATLTGAFKNAWHQHSPPSPRAGAQRTKRPRDDEANIAATQEHHINQLEEAAPLTECFEDDNETPCRLDEQCTAEADVSLEVRRGGVAQRHVLDVFCPPLCYASDDEPVVLLSRSPSTPSQNNSRANSPGAAHMVELDAAVGHSATPTARGSSIENSMWACFAEAAWDMK